ncbi:MAG: pyrimidine/purine nucleotide monophosphate nucleosidase domain-containing protein, partial [Plesiomonas sp.]
LQAIAAHGPYQIDGDKALMRRMDKLLESFVQQHRMKLPGSTAYAPCYEIIT